MFCPKCGTSQSDENICCDMCGIVFEKFASTSSTNESNLEATFYQELEYHSKVSEKPTGWKAIGVCFSVALLIELFSALGHSLQGGLGLLMAFPALALRCISVLIHEMGHAIMAWIFGYPAIPAFDLSYGGGVTVWMGRQTPIVVFVYIILVAIGARYVYAKKYKAVVFISIAILLYSSVTFVQGHNAIILYMGHGMELVFAGIFLYRFLSGNSILTALERPLYGIIGFFIVNELVVFAIKLMTSNSYKDEYHDAKGGGHWMDFDRLANEFFYCSLETVAFVFLLCCLATPILAFLANKYQDKWKGLINRVFSFYS